MCLRQAYERREITEVKWINGSDNPADAMTKAKPCQALKILIDTGLTKRLRFIFSLLRCFTVDLRTVSRTHGHFRGLFGTQFKGLFKGSFLCISFYTRLCFLYVLRFYWSTYGGYTDIVPFSSTANI